MSERPSQVRHNLHQEAAFLALADALSHLLVLIQHGRVVHVNRAGCELLGRAREQFAGRDYWDFVPALDQESIERRERARRSRAQAPRRFTECVRRANGRELWIDYSVDEIQLDGVASILVTGHDVTEHKRAEELLRDRETKLSEAQRVAHVGSWEYDIATDRSTWSAEMYRIFGVNPETFTPSRKTAFARYHDDDRQRVVDTLEAAIYYGTRFEFEARFVRDSGDVRLLHTIGRAERDASGKPVRLYGVAQDITERKRAEEALRASEQRFRSLYTQAPLMMTVIGPDGRFREVSTFWLERMGYDRHEAIGREAYEFITPESHQRFLEEADRTMRAGERVVRSMPITARRKDGTTVDLLTTCMIEIGDDGQFRGAVTAGMDVSHIKEAEDAVRESEARYHALVEYAPDAIAVLDVATATFIDVNTAAERLFGYSRDEILGSSPLKFCPETQPDGMSSMEAVKQHIEQVLAGETPHYVFLAHHSSGREILIDVRSARLPAKGRALIRSSITDITELRALQERVRHDDRMAAIGVLAAGVAHEVGNPLLALSMAVQSLERRLVDEYAQKKLALISDHIDRISKIVRQMSDLARRRHSKKVDCDVARVVGRALEIIRYDKRAKEVKLLFEPAEDLPFVLAIEDQLMQVCLNLGLNALDAVAANPPTRPKRIEVRASRIERDGRPFVHVSFADTGSGIPESARSRVFQPFFTTKPPGTGTGLGLPVSHRIIEEHGGKLDFECADVGRTEFFFDLPVASAPSKAQE